ncbi:3-hydroxyisobutyrate dehydrogenase [Nonomuraea solani]|uniref:3-hydroxyisobutyrate dehydrogenase n=1 Tax=Nonomuraea solani TaxID=1144553 RepID=A0A1H5UTG1_9ACTN|nr:NAD(P)-dependent oxidoreductase [Nonomuraea solani]SEF77497.1 3-hydroxyisobutyrate dehydrogenase [Nonomuraea solani]
MTVSEQRVGWIGTGRMGAPMAERLARAGVDLAVWNRTRAKAESLGATVVDTIADLRSRDVVFTMLATAADLDEVLPELLPGPGVLVDCSTISPEESAAARESCALLGTAFLAAPVSGNGNVARAGALSLVCSGPRETYDRVAGLLAYLGRSVVYVGEGETARLVKIAHNLMLGVVAQTLAEITVLAEKGGVPRHAFLEFLNDSVVGSAFTRYKSPAFVHLDYTPTFTPVLLRKDFDLGLAAARALDVPMPVTALAAQLVQAAVGSGRVDEDFAILLDLQAAASGLELKPEDVAVDDGLGS